MKDLPPFDSQFHNEALANFSKPANRAAMEQALAKVKSELGRTYKLHIAGRGVETGDKLQSINPSHPTEVVGIHSKASAEMAVEAVEDSFAFFSEWRRIQVERRVELAVRAADIIRSRKFEFDAWLVYEAGKSWREAEADVCEAIDFIEYYARQMLRWHSPEPLVQMPGEENQLVYLPLGVGVIIPPWNFPLAIMTGMTMASLICGNTAVIKPSSDTPTIAAKFTEVLLEAGFHPRSFSLVVGSGAVVGDVLVTHPKTRFVSFTGSREVGLRINELAAKPRKGQIWIRRVIAEMGGKNAIVVDVETDVDTAVAGVVASAYGYQGQKCSACSRTIVHEKIYDEFLVKLKEKVEELKVGPAEDAQFDVGPVINAGAKKSILEYIEIGKSEGRLVTGGGVVEGDGYYLQPTVIADVPSTARIFQEEIFGPVLAVSKARDFDHALALANDTEYGLTGAVYTGNFYNIEKACDEFHVGNLYINRKCTGAMVGAHPFGGFNMSGTDSKAGGPDYLLQFLQAKSIAEKIN